MVGTMFSLIDLIEICKGHRVYIQTHNFPDADAIASAFALSELLKNYKIDTIICSSGQIDRLSAENLINLTNIQMYTEEMLEGYMTETDYIICVDSQKHGGNIVDFIGDEIACIDHHPTFKTVNYKWSQIEIVGACSTLIAEHFQKLNIEPTTVCATALLYGIKMDTMHFTRGVTIRDVDAFRYLFERADVDSLRLLETNTLESKDLQAYGCAIENIQIYNRVGFAKIPFACPDGLIASLSDFILSLEEVDVAIIYSKRPNGLKFSIRSLLSKVNAGVLANTTLSKVGNGGGHASMAGGFIPVENYYKLGAYPDVALVNMFMEVINKMRR